MENTKDQRHPRKTGPEITSRIGAGFLALGLLAIIAPMAATTAIVVVLALAMVLWGSLGAAFAYASTSFPDWRMVTVGFVLVAVVGAVFLMFPGLGAEVLTLLIVVSLLLEGLYSILFAVFLMGGQTGWQWIGASGAVALVIGFVILLGWPGMASWLLGVALGINFLSTGIALMLLGRAARDG